MGCALLSDIAILHRLLLTRANAIDAWRRPSPDGLLPWLLAGWGASTIVSLLPLAIPVASLAMLPLTWPVEALVTGRAPPSYPDWW